MTVEMIIESLSADDRRNALELLWTHIERDDASFAPPQWHDAVISERLRNPSSAPSLPLDAAMDEIRRRVDERRTTSGRSNRT